MHPMHAEMMAQAHQEDLLREMEYLRLIRAAMPQQSHRRRFYRRWANWLGIHMVSWGQKLENFGTFGETCSASSLPSQR